MNSYLGQTIVAGTVTGRIALLTEDTIQVDKITIVAAPDEMERLKNVTDKLAEELSRARERVLSEHGAAAAAIIDAHSLLLSDDSKESLIGRACDMISTDMVNAEYAIDKVAEILMHEFSMSDSNYLRSRCEDIQFLRKMLIEKLSGKGSSFTISEPSILVTEELSPEQLTALDSDLVLGIVTSKGSPLSHTAILAENMNVPYLTGCDFDTEDVKAASMGAIDGEDHTFLTSPDEATMVRLEENRKREEKKLSEAMEHVQDWIAESPIALYANIGSVEEAESVASSGASGIGLFRTEFLYMDRESAPDEEEQYQAYKKVLELMGERTVVIRTMDIGGDKLVGCVPMPQENNSALGTRGIRLSFANPDLFMTQLRALLRASLFGNLMVMFPMISAKWEIEEARKYLKKAADELKAEGVEYGHPSIGIMVETPAAALSLDDFSDVIDFVSIGTNDLTQYTLALDRTGDGLSQYYNPYHPAILSLIRITAEAAHRNHIHVGICGALGADPKMLPVFLEYGIDSLSMAPVKILQAASKLHELRLR